MFSHIHLICNIWHYILKRMLFCLHIWNLFQMLTQRSPRWELPGSYYLKLQRTDITNVLDKPWSLPPYNIPNTSPKATHRSVPSVRYAETSQGEYSRDVKTATNERAGNRESPLTKSCTLAWCRVIGREPSAPSFHQHPNCILYENRKSNSEIHTEPERTSNSQNYLEKELSLNWTWLSK